MCSRGEEAAIAGEDGDGDVLALVDFTETLAQKVVEVLVESIELLGVVESDDGHAGLVGDGDEVLVRHGGC